jgi:hypothetical protein
VVIDASSEASLPGMKCSVACMGRVMDKQQTG